MLAKLRIFTLVEELSDMLTNCFFALHLIQKHLSKIKLRITSLI